MLQNCCCSAPNTFVFLKIAGRNNVMELIQDEVCDGKGVPQDRIL